MRIYSRHLQRFSTVPGPTCSPPIQSPIPNPQPHEHYHHIFIALSSVFPSRLSRRLFCLACCSSTSIPSTERSPRHTWKATDPSCAQLSMPRAVSAANCVHVTEMGRLPLLHTSKPADPEVAKDGRHSPAGTLRDEQSGVPKEAISAWKSVIGCRSVCVSNEANRGQGEGMDGNGGKK